MKIIGALLSGVLLYFSYENLWFFGFAIVAFVILFAIIRTTANRLLLFICLFLFTTTFIVLQLSFLNTQESDKKAMLLTIIPVTIYVFPQLILLFAKRFRIEIFIVLWLLSEAFFIRLEIGNPLLQLGNLWGYFPFAVQWYRFTGPLIGSLWMFGLSYVGLKLITEKKGCVLLTGLVLTPLILGVSLEVVPMQNTFPMKRYVAILSLEHEKDGQKIDSILYANRHKNVDYVVASEAIFTYPRQAYEVAPVITSIKRNLLDSLSHACVVIGLWLYDNDANNYNVVGCIKKKEPTAVRYKQQFIPFSEYVPYESVLGKYDVFRENLIYPLTRYSNEKESYVNGYDTVVCLICYEALFIDYMSELVRKNGGQAFFVSASNSLIRSRHNEKVITNVLKSIAITTRRSIVRATEYGLSVMISEKGYLLARNAYKTAFMDSSMLLEKTKTFYTLHYRTLHFCFNLLLIIVLLFLLVLNLVKIGWRNY